MTFGHYKSKINNSLTIFQQFLGCSKTEKDVLKQKRRL